MMKSYYSRMIGRIYKMLPIYEDDTLAFGKYIRSLYLEFCKNDEFEKIVEIGFKIKGLSSQDISHEDVRRTMLDCTNTVEKIILNWSDVGE